MLIHGYMGTPFEMEPLVAPLADLGLSPHLITLPGHSGSVDEFRRTGFSDWRAHAEAEYDKLAAGYDAVIVIGFSLGGALALHLAEERSPAAVITLAAPVFPREAWLRQIRCWLEVFLPGRKILRPYRPEAQSIAPWRGYKDVAHLPHFYGLCKGFAAVREKLGRVRAPLLVFHDLRDKIVHSDNARAISLRVPSGLVRLELTRIKENRTVRHIITTHVETRNVIIDGVRSFVSEVCGFPAPAMWLDAREP